MCMCSMYVCMLNQFSACLVCLSMIVWVCVLYHKNVVLLLYISIPPLSQVCREVCFGMNYALLHFPWDGQVWQFVVADISAVIDGCFFLGLVVDGVYHSKKKILHRIWGKQSCWKVEACAVSGSWDLTQYHKRQITWTKPALHLKAPLPHSWTASPPITCQSSWRAAYLQMTSKKVGKCSQSERFNHLSSVDILVNCFSAFLLYWHSKYI